MSIKLVISDVDGTIVGTDKSILPSTIAAAKRIQAAGIPLAIVSARPPRGMQYIAETLRLSGPFGGFNGGRVMSPEGKVLEEHLVPEPAARSALGLFAARGLMTFVFAGDEWLIIDPNGPHVDHERRTVRFEPTIVETFEPYLDRVLKMVGVSDDEPFLAGVETELQTLLHGSANAKRSQTYYLDLTALEANKGAAVRMLARVQGVELEEVAVLGDMLNDVPMFEVAGFSVAMGNASDQVKRLASASVSSGNDDGGWAEAIDTLILPRAKR